VKFLDGIVEKRGCGSPAAKPKKQLLGDRRGKLSHFIGVKWNR